MPRGFFSTEQRLKSHFAYDHISVAFKISGAAAASKKGLCHFAGKSAFPSFHGDRAWVFRQKSRLAKNLPQICIDTVKICDFTNHENSVGNPLAYKTFHLF